jgi:hypothetical protein
MATTKVFPRLEAYMDFPVYARAVREGASGLLDPSVKFCDEVADEIDLEGAERFLAAHPQWNAEFHSEANGKKLLDWCRVRRAPCSLWNLSVAFNALSADGSLERVTPSQAPEANTGNPSITLARSDALAEYQPSEQETENLEKLSDDTTLSDHARKTKDKKLRALAQQQQREYATLPAHYNQKIVI